MKHLGLRRFALQLWPLVLLTVGLVATALAGWQQHRANEALVQDRLQVLAERVADRVLRRLRLYEYGLRGVRAAVAMSADQAQQLSREDFRRLSVSQDIRHQYPGVLGFAFARRVRRGHEAAFLASMHRNGWPEAQIREDQSHAGDRFVTQFIEPMEANTKVLGFDIASDLRRRETAEAATRSGEPHITAPIFVQRLNLRSPAAVAAPIALTSLLLLLLLLAGLRARQREIRIAAERAQTAAVVDGAHDAIIRHTPGGHVLGWNAAAERLLGWRSCDAQGRSLLELTVPLQQREEARQALARVQRGEAVPPLDTVRLDCKGQPVAVSLSISPIRSRDGRITGAATTMRDIREQLVARSRIEQANATLEATLQQLRHSEARARQIAELLEQLIESAPDPIWTKDQYGRWQVINSAAAAVIGRPRESLIGLRKHDVLPPDYAAQRDAQDQRILREGRAQHFEDEVFDAGRSEPRTFYSIKAPLRTVDGRVMGLLGIARDITERKAAEARLEQLNATLEEQVRDRTATLEQLAERERAILASAASAIIATDMEGCITAFNPAAEAMFLLPAGQALGRPVLDLYDPQDLQAHQAEFPADVLQVLLPGVLASGELEPPGAVRSEWRYLRADGTRFPGLLSVSVLRDVRSQPMGMLGVVTDLTERKALEESLRQRTRQAESANQAKSMFLAHMSHEIRTPLNAVIGLSQLLARMDLLERALHFVSHIGQAGEQLLALTNDVLDLSRIEAGELQLERLPFELPSALQAVCGIVEPQAVGKGLALHCDVPPALPQRLLGDVLRLKQVLLNLLSNAVKFTSEGSVILRVRELALQASA